MRSQYRVIFFIIIMASYSTFFFLTSFTFNIVATNKIGITKSP